jgi:hypothetical protein
MAVYSYPTPNAPKFKKPTSVEDCLPQARNLAVKEHTRVAMGPVKKGGSILVVTFPDQDPNVKEAVTQALEEKGAEKVTFMCEHELSGKESLRRSVEEGWREADDMFYAPTGTEEMPFAEELTFGVRKYLDENPEYNTVFLGIGGRKHTTYALRQHGSKFKGNWLFNNWEEFIAPTWSFPDELWKEIERPAIEAIGRASKIRITDPEGTDFEYSLTEEEALRFQMCAWKSGHLFLDALQATSEECSIVPVDPQVPPVFHDLNGVLAGTANHVGYFPRMELYFEHGLLVGVKGGGKYGEIIQEMMEKYKDVHFPGYPGKGFFWFCDSALCTAVKGFRRTSDMFNVYGQYSNLPERNRAGVFHHGIGSRRHFGEVFFKYIKDNDLPHSHIHMHNYFTTFEVKLRGTGTWLKVTDRGWLTSLDDPKIRTLAVKYGNPDQLLSYDWVPPLPGINCEGDYLKDYAPDPVGYMRKRMKEGKSI